MTKTNARCRHEERGFMDLEEIKELLNKLSKQEREELFKNLRRITFDFKINKSFLGYPNHPLTIPKEFYSFLDIHGIKINQDATVVFPDGSTATGYIHYSKAGWGEYYQIRIRTPYSGVGISRFKVGDIIKVEIFKVDENIRIELSNRE